MDYTPQDYFDLPLLNYPVLSRKHGSVFYANFDHAATTPPFKAVTDGVNKFLTGYGSVHRGSGGKSIESTRIYDHAREEIKRFVNAPKDSYLVYTGNTTGAMNTIAALLARDHGQIMYSNLEHSSSRLPFVLQEGYVRSTSNDFDNIQYAGLSGCIEYPLDPHTGKIDVYRLLELGQSHGPIKAVILTATSNLTGATPDIKAVADVTHELGAYLVLDACQYLQHHEVDMQSLGADFICASGHKFYAPFGGGFLVGPKEFFDRHLPYQIGGGNLPWIDRDGKFISLPEERTYDAGTPNAVGAVSMQLALNTLQHIGMQTVHDYEQKLTREILAELVNLKHLRVYSSPESCNIITFSFDHLNSEEAADRLFKDYGIGVRAGQFCAYEAVRQLLQLSPQQDEKISSALQSSGSSADKPSLIRASLGLQNTENDAHRLIEACYELARG